MNASEASHDRSHVETDDPTPRRRISLKLRLGLALTCAFGAAVMLGLASGLWLPGFVPALAFVAGFLAPTFVITVLLSAGFDPEDDELVDDESAPALVRAKLAASALLVPGLACALACAAWMWGPTRAQAALSLHEMGDEGALARCAGDPSTDVALACCEGASERDRSLAQLPNILRMQHDEGAERACFVSSIDGTSPHTNAIAKYLASRWEGRLVSMDPEADPDEVCESARALASMEHVEGSETPLRLLHCALSSKHPAAKQCCAGELRAIVGANANLPAIMPPPGRMAQSMAGDLTPLILEASYPSFDESLDRRTHPIAAATGLDTIASRAWSTELACSFLDGRRDPLQRQVHTRLAIGLGASGCVASEETLSAGHLTNGCRSWLDAGERERPLASLCEHTVDIARASAHIEAHSRVRIAHLRAQMGGDSRSMRELALDPSSIVNVGAARTTKGREMARARTRVVEYQEMLRELRDMQKAGFEKNPAKSLQRIEELRKASKIR